MFYLTIFIVILLFIWDITLDYLNYKYRKQPIPKLVDDIYNKEDYSKWLEYTMENFKLDIFKKVVKTLFLVLLLSLNVFLMISDITIEITSNRILQAILFLGMYAFIDYFIDIWFSLYKTFNIEERYGFNTSTVKTFIVDELKSAILFIVLGGGLLFIILFLYQSFGNAAILYSWIVVMVIVLVFQVLYTKVFIKLFSKLTPLEEGELYDKIVEFAKSMGYEIKDISIKDESKRSTRLNAFFTGFGKFKSIVLYDNLIEKLSIDEVVSVVAHETGHAKNKDVLRNILTSAVSVAFYLGLLSFFLSATRLASAFGFEQVNYGFAIILFGILMRPLGIILDIPLSAMSRKAEYLADGYAVKAGYKDAMISALKVLAKENFANLTPHPLVVKMTYSHPTVNQRLEALNNGE